MKPEVAYAEKMVWRECATSMGAAIIQHEDPMETVGPNRQICALKSVDRRPID